MPNCLKCWQKQKPDVGAPHQQMPLGTSKRWSVQCQSRELCFRDAVPIVYSTFSQTVPSLRGDCLEGGCPLLLTQEQ
ncbi:unnamed protein product [Gadus morhua 'NCC']